VPTGWTADVSATPDFFSVTYKGTDGTQSFTLAIQAANPPPPDKGTTQRKPSFRHDPRSLYQVQNAMSQGSARYLLWSESGKTSSGESDVPYLLSTAGIIDVDFWRIADGLTEEVGEVIGDGFEIPFSSAPSSIKLKEGLTLPVPQRWYGQHNADSYWELVDHNPAVTKTLGLGISMFGGRATAQDLKTATSCPAALEETRIDYCGFVSFAGHRWRHLIGRSDISFTDYFTIAGHNFVRLTGFYSAYGSDGDQHARLEVEALIRAARFSG